MRIRHLLMVAVMLIVVSCAKNEKNQGEILPVLSVETFSENAGDYVGKEITIEGTVVHVCKHGGQKMFIMGNDPEGRVKVLTGGDIEFFDLTLEGSEVTINGIVEELRIDEEYLSNWEDEITNPEGEEIVDDHHNEASDQIAAYREEINNCAFDHLSFYSIKGQNFSIKETNEE